jgi:hypothetical protein
MNGCLLGWDFVSCKTSFHIPLQLLAWMHWIHSKSHSKFPLQNAPAVPPLNALKVYKNLSGNQCFFLPQPVGQSAATKSICMLLTERYLYSKHLYRFSICIQSYTDDFFHIKTDCSWLPRNLRWGLFNLVLSSCATDNQLRVLLSVLEPS